MMDTALPIKTQRHPATSTSQKLQPKENSMVDCSRRMMGGEEAVVDELQKSKVNPVRVIRLAPYRGTTMRRRLERTQRAKAIQRKIEV